MRIKYYLLFNFLLTCKLIFSQTEYITKGKIIDNFTVKPLPYVSVMVLNKAVGTSTDKNGNFSIKSELISSNDSLLLSHVGYESIKISLNDITNIPIKLRMKNIKLEEVKISFDKTSKKKEYFYLNKFKKNRTSLVYSLEPFNNKSNLWLPFRENEPTIETMYFPYNEEYGKFTQLEEVIINLRSFKTESKIRLRIFQADDESKPGNEVILQNPIIKVSDDESLIKIDLHDEYIYTSKEGIFIGVEYLIIPENLTLEKNLKENVETNLYSPFLKYIRVKGIYEYFIFTKAKWEKVRKIAPNYIINSKNSKEFSYKPAISVKLRS